MSLLFNLLKLDSIRLKGWFRTKPFIKALVMLAFLVLLLTVSWAIHAFSKSFFLIISNKQEFGQAVASYTLNSSILVLLVLSTLSSIAASFTNFFRSPRLEHLFSLPIHPTNIFLNLNFRSLIQSSWAALVLLAPALLAYSQVFSTGPYFFARSLLVIGMIILIGQALGSIIVTLTAHFFGQLTKKIILTSVLLSLAFVFILGRLLFPPQFYKLYQAPDWPQFQKQLGQLPLVSTKLPSTWLTLTITDGLSSFTYLSLSITSLLIISALIIGHNYYLPAYRKTRERKVLAGKHSQITKKSQYPLIFPSKVSSLVLNDFLWVTRSPQELGYLIFLFILGLIYLFVINKVPLLKTGSSIWLPIIYTTTFVGLNYIIMVFAARIIYPLLAREKQTAWFLFSSPIKRSQVLLSKTIFSLLTLAPWLILGLIAPFLLAMPPIITTFFISLFILTAITTSIIQLMLGVIDPNFQESQNPEATSTSASGLSAIILSLAFISFSTLNFNFILFGKFDISTILTLTLLAGFLVITILTTTALNKIHHYQI